MEKLTLLEPFKDIIVLLSFRLGFSGVGILHLKASFLILFQNNHRGTVKLGDFTEHGLL